MTSFLINPYRFAAPYDTDAQAYITAVEAADGQPLETGVRDAINAFVVGCKADGIWSAIKASCILAGARTLSGALVPLVGTAPTNNNFVSGDYNRKTGLTGNASTKWLNTNRNNTSDPQNSRHASAWVTSAGVSRVNARLIQAGNTTSAGDSGITTGHDPAGFGGTGPWPTNPTVLACASSLSPFFSPVIPPGPTGFFGVSRSNATSIDFRSGFTSYVLSQTSGTPQSKNYGVFAIPGDPAPQFFGGSIAFFSIGESIGLSSLESRVSTLISALAAAIP